MQNTSRVDDILSFKTMLTPALIRILFLVGVIFVFVVAIFTLVKFGGVIGALVALLELIFGVIWVRITLEVAIVFFRINETLTEIQHLMNTKDAEGTFEAQKGTL